VLVITTALVVLYAFVTTRAVIGRQMIYAVASTSTISAAVQREATRGQDQRDRCSAIVAARLPPPIR
jgi:hypothetical protein